MFIWCRKGHFLGLNSVEGWFGAGNPRYIAGMSGIELAERVILLALYPTHHEAYITKLVELATTKMDEVRNSSMNSLKRQRKSAGLTQQQLAEKSGVKLRMIQAYEQNYQDISKAEVGSIIRLAKTLSCRVEDLLE